MHVSPNQSHSSDALLGFTTQCSGLAFHYNLPHNLSEMFSGSADRKQFHLPENSLPPLPTSTQQRPPPSSSNPSAGCWDTTLSFTAQHSIFPHQKVQQQAGRQTWMTGHTRTPSPSLSSCCSPQKQRVFWLQPVCSNLCRSISAGNVIN